MKNHDATTEAKFDDGPRIDPDEAEARAREKAQSADNGTNPAEEDEEPLIEVFSPKELRSYVTPVGYNLVGNYHITRGGLSVLAGAPGVGKSRVATALAVCGSVAFPWFGYTVSRKFKTLIIQSQNGRVRLKTEYDELGTAVDQYIKVSGPPRRGLAFNNAKFRDQLGKIIAEFGPDLIIIDPWNNVAHDITQKDYDTALSHIRLVVPSGDDSPAVFIICHTRKPQAHERANGRALLNTVAGSYFLGAEARSVFVLLTATDSPNDNRLVMTCCKNNDGELGQTRAWNPSDSGLYEEIKDFDWKSFYSYGKSKAAKGEERWRNVAIVIFDLGGEATKAQIVKELLSRFEIAKAKLTNGSIKP